MENTPLLYDPAVFVVGRDYQIIFLTATAGIGWIEIGGERYTDEEAGLLFYGKVHKIPVPGEILNAAGRYTAVFVEYADKKPYFPEGTEKLRREYRFTPLPADKYRVFHFADTHARTKTPLELYREVGDCDLIVLNGDINEHSYSLENFETAFALASGSSHGEKPVIYSRGNHDTRGYAAQDLVNYIPTAFRGGRRETFYSFRQGSLWGVVLDCGEDKWDYNPEYGGTILFDTFRKRETAYLESLIENRVEEYEAEGVKTKLAICHVPLVERFEHPFNVADELYEYWTRLLEKIGIDLLLAGHMHRAYFIDPHTPEKRNADFLTAVCSIPSKKRADGTETYVGGLIEVDGARRTVRAVPDGEERTF